MSQDVNEAISEEARQRQIKRNIRLTGAVLWLIVGAIFFYMIGKYYWMSK